MSIKIKMFTSNNCGQCKVAKAQLSFLPVPVEIEEINIEEFQEDYYGADGELYASPLEYLTEILDSMATPTFEFEDGTVVRGFEIGQLMEKIGL